jgi:hypothetical protein
VHTQTKDGRVLFFLPFEGYVIAGTTDVGCEVGLVQATPVGLLLSMEPCDVCSAWIILLPDQQNILHHPVSHCAISHTMM